MQETLNNCPCCNCQQPLKGSEQVNIIATNHIVIWDVPAQGNILHDSIPNTGLAYVCDSCYKLHPGEFQFVVEYKEEEFILHRAKDLPLYDNQIQKDFRKVTAEFNPQPVEAYKDKFKDLLSNVLDPMDMDVSILTPFDTEEGYRLMIGLFVYFPNTIQQRKELTVLAFDKSSQPLPITLVINKIAGFMYAVSDGKLSKTGEIVPLENSICMIYDAALLDSIET